MDIYRNLFSQKTVPQVVSGDQLIVHLKLLETLYQLRRNVEQCDGLYGVKNGEKIVDCHNRQETIDHCQQRWAVYVQLAADRFQTWWTKAVMPKLNASKITRSQLDAMGSEWVEFQQPYNVNINELPPIDVLMIWHAYMLNPRTYLEDCVRLGLGGIWAADMPWGLLNQSLIADLDRNNGMMYSYNPGTKAKADFELMTGLPWESLDDKSPTKELLCPSCGTLNYCPWLSVRNDGNDTIVDTSSYSTSSMIFMCSSCSYTFSHDKLRFEQFMKDLEEYTIDNVPMPGTLLHVDTNMPTSSNSHRIDMILSQSKVLLEYLRPFRQDESLSTEQGEYMQLVKSRFQEAFEQFKMEHQRNKGTTKMLKATAPLVRRIMSCYWSNSSIFGQDLSACAIRQAKFIENMHRLDWVHSPCVSATMEKAIVKYQRFIDLLGIRRSRMVVPTLDVDLAWHTHQLSPMRYYTHTTRVNKMLVNHDDKIGETSLSRAFTKTTRYYEEKYKEPYSECLCWYCEAVRQSNSAVVSTSKIEKQLFKKLPNFQDYNNCPGPHISTHNAIQEVEKGRALEETHQKLIWRNYQEAYKQSIKRAKKLHRAPPPPCENFQKLIRSLHSIPPNMLKTTASCACDEPEGYGNCVNGSCSSLNAAGSCGVGSCGGGITIPSDSPFGSCSAGCGVFIATGLGALSLAGHSDGRYGGCGSGNGACSTGGPRKAGFCGGGGSAASGF